MNILALQYTESAVGKASRKGGITRRPAVRTTPARRGVCTKDLVARIGVCIPWTTVCSVTINLVQPTLITKAKSVQWHIPAKQHSQFQRPKVRNSSRQATYDEKSNCRIERLYYSFRRRFSTHHIMHRRMAE